MEINIEQEFAAVMAFVLEYAENPTPYYLDIPKNFQFPAMFFPQPEIETSGDTMNTYALHYYWYIDIFDKTTAKAYERAQKALDALKRKRNLVPLSNKDGSGTNKNLRLDNPSLKIIDTGVVKLVLSWISRRPYDREAVQKMMKWQVKKWHYPDIGNKA